MTVGYARVSTQDQNLNLQLDALKKAGCERIFKEEISAVKKNRPAFDEMLNFIRKGDCVVVWKLDRLGRSLLGLIKIINRFKNEGIEFVSITDTIDTSTPMGRFIFHVFASLAEYEREIIIERTKAGLAAARARGRKGGRPPGLSKKTIEKAKAIHALYYSGYSIKQISLNQNCSNNTVYKARDYVNKLLKQVDDNKSQELMTLDKDEKEQRALLVEINGKGL